MGLCQLALPIINLQETVVSNFCVEPVSGRRVQDSRESHVKFSLEPHARSTTRLHACLGTHVVGVCTKGGCMHVCKYTMCTGLCWGTSPIRCTDRCLCFSFFFFSLSLSLCLGLFVCALYLPICPCLGFSLSLPLKQHVSLSLYLSRWQWALRFAGLVAGATGVCSRGLVKMASSINASSAVSSGALWFCTSYSSHQCKETKSIAKREGKSKEAIHR